MASALKLEEFIEENAEASGEGNVEASCGTDPEAPAGLGYYTCEYEEGTEIRLMKIEIDGDQVNVTAEK